MNFKLSTLLVFCLLTACGQHEAYFNEIKKHRLELYQEFSNPETTPFIASDLKQFKGLSYFETDVKYRVQAKFIRTPDAEPFIMITSGKKRPEYVKWGELHFELDGVPLKLSGYRNTKYLNDTARGNYLFIPFTDYTNGEETYGGGRYVDTEIPEGDGVLLDFNKAYSPYCAYNGERYSCPIPPRENALAVKIMAGVKAYENSDH